MTCSIEGCTKKGAYVKGLCPMHYQRQRIHGDTSYRQSTSAEAIAQRFWGKVVQGDGCWSWLGYTDAVSGYARFHVVNRDLVAHRYSYELLIGPIPEGMVVDHICHNRACVSPEHLRLATPKQNAENRAGANRTSKTGVRGVSWDPQSEKWLARLGHNNKHLILGRFDSIEEAEAVVKAKRAELFTHSIEVV